VLLAGCGGSDGPAVTEADDAAGDTTSTTTTTVVDDPSAGAEAYMRAFASNDPQTMLEMQDLAQRGSLAYGYALHQQAVTEVLQQGATPVPDDVVVTEDTVVLTGMDDNNQPYDTTYGDFEVDPDTGRLVNFTVNGTALEGRISVGGQAVTAHGITVAPFTAYQTVVSDDLWVVVDITNNAGQPFSNAAYDSSYVGPDGIQTQAETADAADEIQAGATARALITFLGAPLGGQLFYKGFLDDFLTEVNVTVTIPAS
jgi:hypothetical protein